MTLRLFLVSLAFSVASTAPVTAQSAFTGASGGGKQVSTLDLGSSRVTQGDQRGGQVSSMDLGSGRVVTPVGQNCRPGQVNCRNR